VRILVSGQRMLMPQFAVFASQSTARRVFRLAGGGHEDDVT
jgi:hypothetical protein